MRKILLVLLLICTLGLCGCDSKEFDDNNDDHKYCGGLPPMTTEEIKLTYYSFESELISTELAKRFEKKYPNIDVKVICMSKDDADSILVNMVENGEMPDCFMFLDCDIALANEYLYDMTKLWESDTENMNLLPSINEAKLGYMGTDRKWATPMVYYPGVFFVERYMVKNAGLDMPDIDWTWNEMIEFVKEATKKNGERQYYGLCEVNRLDMYYDVATQLAIGPYGYYGSSFDFSDWSNGVKQYVELKNGGFVTPNIIEPGIDICPPDIRMCLSGEIAVLPANFDWYLGYLDAEDAADGLDYVPYIVPAAKQNSVKAPYTKSTMYMGGISSRTEHPREAYELLKYMGWGADGWKARLEIYKDDSIKNGAGMPAYQDSMPVPITLDEEVWTEYKKFFYDGAESIKYWDYYFDNCLQGIPDGISTIPGYSKFHNEYFGTYKLEEEFYERIDSGEVDIDKLAAEMEAKLEKYHAEAMLEYFDIDISKLVN